MTNTSFDWQPAVPTRRRLIGPLIGAIALGAILGYVAVYVAPYFASTRTTEDVPPVDQPAVEANKGPPPPAARTAEPPAAPATDAKAPEPSNVTAMPDKTEPSVVEPAAPVAPPVATVPKAAPAAEVAGPSTPQDPVVLNPGSSKAAPSSSAVPQKSAKAAPPEETVEEAPPPAGGAPAPDMESAPEIAPETANDTAAAGEPEDVDGEPPAEPVARRRVRLDGQARDKRIPDYQRLREELLGPALEP